MSSAAASSATAATPLPPPVAAAPAPAPAPAAAVNDDDEDADDPALHMDERTRRAWARWRKDTKHTPFPDPRIFTSVEENCKAVSCMKGDSLAIAVAEVQKLYVDRKDFKVRGKAGERREHLLAFYGDAAEILKTQDTKRKTIKKAQKRDKEIKEARESKFTRSEQFRLALILMDRDNEDNVRRMLARGESREEFDADGAFTFIKWVPKLFNNKECRPQLPGGVDFDIPADIDMNKEAAAHINFKRGGLILNRNYNNLRAWYTTKINNFKASGQNKSFEDFYDDGDEVMGLIHAYVVSGVGVQGLFDKTIPRAHGGFQDGGDTSPAAQRGRTSSSSSTDTTNRPFGGGSKKRSRQQQADGRRNQSNGGCRDFFSG